MDNSSQAIISTTLADSRERKGVLLSWLSSPLGPLLAGANEEGICLLEFADPQPPQAHIAAVQERFTAPVLAGKSSHLERLQEQLTSYFAGKLREFTLPLVYPGTAFQRRVWEQLLQVPYGKTWSYKELATAIGSPKAMRAVGRANGLNRIAILIPCHRIVNHNGDLGGYGGGFRRKQFLLNLEQGHLNHDN